MYYEVYEKGMVTSCTQYYHQWRTQKIFMGGVHSVADSGHLYLMCAVCDVTL